jgi:predicted transcriptional regulator
MKEGFVVSGRFRKAVFSAIASGDSSIETIIKKERLQRPQAEGALKELVESGLVEDRDGKIALTEEGEKTLAALKKERMI